jgi:hypothetical protein
MQLRSACYGALCFLVLFMAACTKPHEQITESTYTFTNQTGQRVTLDLYPTKTDYGKNTNRLQRLVLGPDSSDKLKLNVGQSYWVDWYTDDYAYNNWNLNSNEVGLRQELKVADIDDTRTLSGGYKDTTRSIMLNGSGTSSTWKGIVSASTGADGIHVFVFQKDLTLIHTFTNTAGQTSTEQLTYRIYSISRDFYTTYYFSFSMDRNGIAVYRGSCNLKNMFPTTGRDSLYITPVNTSGGTVTNFFVVRQ